MRLIFIVLLVGNILFFGAQLFGKKTHADSTRKSVATDHRFGTLQTVAERDGGGNKDDKKVIAKAEPLPSASPERNSEDKCQLVGPFVELLHAEYLVERLKSLDVVAVVTHIEIMDGKNYWVYLKPEISEKEAWRSLHEIQAKSIDSYIIPSGELANGILFGQFNNSEEANKKVEQVRAQGYPAEIKEIPKGHSEIWVEVREQKEQKLSGEQWSDLLKEEKAVERRQNYCLGVANK